MKLEGIFLTPECEAACQRLVEAFLSEKRERGTVTYDPLPPRSEHDCAKGECFYVTVESREESSPDERQKSGKDALLVAYNWLPADEAIARIPIKKQSPVVGADWSGGNDPLSRVSQMRGEPRPEQSLVVVWPEVKS